MTGDQDEKSPAGGLLVTLLVSLGLLIVFATIVVLSLPTSR